MSAVMRPRTNARRTRRVRIANHPSSLVMRVPPPDTTTTPAARSIMRAISAVNFLTSRWARPCRSDGSTSKIITMVRRLHRRSPLALAVLGLLYEAPMHPYRMQQLLKERGKDEVINVGERASIYQTIDRLRREGLVTVVQTARDEKRPERTVYQLTEEGRETTRDWLREMLSTPAREFPAFPAALAFLPLLTPEDALR